MLVYLYAGIVSWVMMILQINYIFGVIIPQILNLAFAFNYFLILTPFWNLETWTFSKISCNNFIMLLDCSNLNVILIIFFSLVYRTLWSLAWAHKIGLFLASTNDPKTSDSPVLAICNTQLQLQVPSSHKFSNFKRTYSMKTKQTNNGGRLT